MVPGKQRVDAEFQNSFIHGTLSLGLVIQIQTPKKIVIARLQTDEATARCVGDALGDAFDGIAISTFRQNEGWTLEIVLDPEKNPAAVLAALNDLAPGQHFALETLEEQDWVGASLAGLKPVRAGRFFVHGAHDRASVPANAIGIEIEAALAFGTGHHGTTRGCLLALDRVLKCRKPRLVFDVGTGSGVLAIAAARAAHARVVATDIDVTARRAARDNVVLNRAAGWVTILPATAGPRALYDLILANILALPLMQLSRRLAMSVAPAGRIVLSGLMPEHAAAVISAYRRQGLALEHRLLIEGWVTLTMRRP